MKSVLLSIVFSNGSCLSLVSRRSTADTELIPPPQQELSKAQGLPPFPCFISQKFRCWNSHFPCVCLWERSGWEKPRAGFSLQQRGGQREWQPEIPYTEFLYTVLRAFLLKPENTLSLSKSCQNVAVLVILSVKLLQMSGTINKSINLWLANI